MAIATDIFGTAGLFGAGGGLALRIVAKIRDQRRGIIDRAAAGNEWEVHDMSDSGVVLPDATKNRVNSSSTIWSRHIGAGAALADLPSALAMTKSRNTAAGGVFIFLGVLAGMILGVINHNLSAYIIGGTAVGIAVAIVVWLIDRSRR
nr:hypothetical protein [uncultured Sphingomonas sp.]